MNRCLYYACRARDRESGVEGAIDDGVTVWRLALIAPRPPGNRRPAGRRAP
jgi:hypothetical protein